MSHVSHFYVYMFKKLDPSDRLKDVFPFQEGIYIYERTCGTERAARERVRELEERGDCDRALYLVNHTIRGAFY